MRKFVTLAVFALAVFALAFAMAVALWIDRLAGIGSNPAQSESVTDTASQPNPGDPFGIRVQRRRPTASAEKIVDPAQLAVDCVVFFDGKENKVLCPCEMEGVTSINPLTVSGECKEPAGKSGTLLEPRKRKAGR